MVRPETEDNGGGGEESLLASQTSAKSMHRSSGDRLPALPSAQRETLREIDEVRQENLKHFQPERENEQTDGTTYLQSVDRGRVATTLPLQLNKIKPTLVFRAPLLNYGKNNPLHTSRESTGFFRILQIVVSQTSASAFGG